MTDATFEFIRAAVEDAIHSAHKKRGIKDARADEIVSAVVASAARDFGLCAAAVLSHMGMRDGADVGKAVFQMIEDGWFTRDKKDRIEHFDATSGDLPCAAMSLAREEIRGIGLTG